MSDQLRRRLADPRLLLFAAPFILLAPVWLTGQALYWGTPSTQFIPWWWRAYQTLRAGQLPLWNPDLGMGAPLLANYQSGLLYPLNWTYLILAAVGGPPLMAWAQSLLVAAHLAFAGWGMAKLIERLGLPRLPQAIGGLAFGLSGYLVARAHFLSINATVAWLPWVLLAAYDLAQKPDRRELLKLALVLALQWLAGHAQTAWYSLLLAVAWFIYWAWPRRRQAFLPFIAALGLAFALAAAQLLPTLEYLLQSARVAQLDRAFALNYSFWPWRFLTLLAPNFFGNPASGDFWAYGNFWEDAVYIGVLPIALALAAIFGLRRASEHRSLKRLLLILVLLSFLLALGAQTPLFPFLYETVPTFNLFQAPTRFSLIAVFALCLLAALAAARWRRPQGRALYWSRLAVAAAFAIVAAAALAPQFSSTIPTTFIRATVIFGLLALGLAILNLLAPTDPDSPSPRWTEAVALFLVLDLLWAGWGLNPGAPLELYRPTPNEAVASIEFTADDSRVYMSRADEGLLKFERFFRFDSFATDESPSAVRSALLPNTTLLDGIASANNFDPLLPARYQNWIDALEAAPPAIQTEMLARMGVTWLEEVDADTYETSFNSLSPRPRLRWLPCARIVPNAERALNLVASGELASDQVAVEIPDAQVHEICGNGDPQPAHLDWLERTPNHLSIAVDAPSGGWLLLADTYYPGWKATADGESLPIYPADGLFRAVNLPAGSYVLNMDYRPLSFLLGAALSILAWIAWLILWRRTSHEN